jgi:hypothetical protein
MRGNQTPVAAAIAKVERLRQIDESIEALIEVITAAVSPAVSGPSAWIFAPCRDPCEADRTPHRLGQTTRNPARPSPLRQRNSARSRRRRMSCVHTARNLFELAYLIAVVSLGAVFQSHQSMFHRVLGQFRCGEQAQFLFDPLAMEADRSR